MTADDLLLTTPSPLSLAGRLRAVGLAPDGVTALDEVVDVRETGDAFDHLEELSTSDLMRAHVRLKWTTNGSTATATPEFVVKAGGSGALLAVLNFAEFKSGLLIAVQQDTDR